jgi:predicted RNA binding protein YcfA (HicA-like mRNA interferase family)
VSPSLPVVSGTDVVKALRKAGFDEVSQRGSHMKLRDEHGRTVILPLHRELAPGTLRSVLRQASLGAEELAALLVGRGGVEPQGRAMRECPRSTPESRQPILSGRGLKSCLCSGVS